MIHSIDNWKTQARKGYLDLCILLLLKKKGRLYGFEILDLLEVISLPIKEGTLYPLLNRMTGDNLLTSVWETEGSTHPRKFYSLTDPGRRTLQEMQQEFDILTSVYKQLTTEEK